MRYILLLIILTLPQIGQGQYTYWNNVYPLLGEALIFISIYSGLIAHINHWELVG